MTFREAADFVMPIGKHQTKTIDEIGTSDEGLLYLDWLRGERGNKGEALDEALATYLDDVTIRKDLTKLQKAQKKKRRHGDD